MEKKKGVLIIDDDKFLLDMYAMKFTENGFDVETALSGSDALTMLESGKKPDIVLLDIVMPGVDGFEVLKTIKDKKLVPDATLVVLSNLGQKEDVDKGLSLGASGYIVKASATPSEVVTKVKEITAKHA
ncbi:MAG TPA: response regulator [Candidatus Paceibacterota bacterium]